MKALLLLPLLLAACAKPNYADDAAPGSPGGNARAADAAPRCFRDGACLSYEWEKLPTEDDFGSLRFHTRPGDPAYPPALVLWMPAMGHGSSPVKIERLGVGEYRASNVFFTMRGEWQLRFQLKADREVKDEIILPFTF